MISTSAVAVLDWQVGWPGVLDHLVDERGCPVRPRGLIRRVRRQAVALAGFPPRAIAGRRPPPAEAAGGTLVPAARRQAPRAGPRERRGSRTGPTRNPGAAGPATHGRQWAVRRREGVHREDRAEVARKRGAANIRDRAPVIAGAHCFRDQELMAPERRATVELRRP